MRKCNLLDGRVVKLRDGRNGIIKEAHIYLENGLRIPLNDYNDNLTNHYTTKADIVEVGENEYKKIWERVKLKDKEIELSKTMKSLDYDILKVKRFPLGSQQRDGIRFVSNDGKQAEIELDFYVKFEGLNEDEWYLIEKLV
ncbi:MAG: hypothetical protein ACOCQD_02315 [archaeon]